MKATETKTTTANILQQKEQQPFFQKHGEGQSSFFGNAKPSAAPFFNSPTIQTKLTIGQPGDKYEQEADAMADKVVQRISKKDAVQPKCAECAEEEKLQKMEGEEEMMEQEEGIQRKAIFESNEEQPDISPFRNEGVQMKSDAPNEASSDLESRLNSSKGSGQSLSDDTRSSMESAFGSDFGNVRVHTGSTAVQMNQELGAQAFTHGADVYFGAGKYSPKSTEGQRLLGHELTHVVQQGGSVQRKMIQRDLAQSMPTANGTFEIDMTTREDLLQVPQPPGARSGLRGHIRFEPATTAPYSNEIALIQTVKSVDLDTGEFVNSATNVEGRNVRTTEDAQSGVEEGFRTDVEHRSASTGAAAEPGSALAPQYMINQEGIIDAGEYGFKRSDDPADIKKAELFDFPATGNPSVNQDRKFETVAKGEDTMNVYGAIEWGFGIRAGDVVDEYVRVSETPSATFNEALELHRDFYIHEPIIFYFGFDRDALEVAEIAKIDTFLDYLDRFPDVRLSLTGFADRRGDPDYNLDLSLRRAENVKQALIAKGIDEGKIDDIILGMGATEEHTSGDRAPNAGRSQDLEANRRGNRRVTLTFEHTQSFPGQ